MRVKSYYSDYFNDLQASIVDSAACVAHLVLWRPPTVERHQANWQLYISRSKLQCDCGWLLVFTSAAVRKPSTPPGCNPALSPRLALIGSTASTSKGAGEAVTGKGWTDGDKDWDEVKPLTSFRQNWLRKPLCASANVFTLLVVAVISLLTSN